MSVLALVLLLLSALFNPLGPHPVTVVLDGTYAWSLSDRITGTVTGSPNQDTDTFSTESMVKPWIAADFLRRGYSTDLATPPPPARMRELARMIDLSDDDAAQDIYRLDGGDAVIARMAAVCGLAHTAVHPAWWSRTTMTAGDARRLGLCLADGRAAGPWTGWLALEMAHVEGGADEQQATTGGGRWGAIDALSPPDAAITSIKNGWTDYDGAWHVNCLAVHRFFVLSVMSRYPSGHGLAYGAALCRDITRQLRKPTAS
jgi:hypothetical protein